MTILPISRGEYVIARMDAYHTIPDVDDGGVLYMNFPSFIESVDYTNITSESAAINCAYVSGIFSDFIEDEELLPTVSGRMSSGSFSFSIQNTGNVDLQLVNVNNSQIEIDGGYEGLSSLSLIEAKTSLASDFLVRQLYYPFRLWREKVTKDVKTVFLVYSNGLFHLYQYCFEEPSLYNSIKLEKYQRYSLQESDITVDDIQRLLNSIESIDEPRIPFPQADSFERIINLCELLFDADDLSREDVTTTFDFDVRQTNYYTDAGRYLGLITRSSDDGIKYELTDAGKALFVMNHRERQMGFATRILQHAVFAKALDLHLENGEAPNRSDVTTIMKDSDLYRINAESTYTRRASTVLSWTNWILSLID